MRRIYVLPWARFEESFDFGPYRFEAFFHRSRLKVLSDIENDNLNFLVGRFLGPRNEEGSFLTVAYSTLSEDNDANMFQQCVDAVAYVCMNYGGVFPDMADQFTFFTVDLESASRSTNMRLQWGGRIVHDLGSNDIVQPPYYLIVNGPLIRMEPSFLISAFHDVLFDGKGDTSLFHSLRWYNLVHTKAAWTTRFVQLVYLCTAFETLFQLPFGRKKKPFRDRLSEIYSGTGVDIPRLKTWADSFYDVRSEIVHSQIVSDLCFEDVGKDSHLEIGCGAYSGVLIHRMGDNLKSYKALVDDLNHSMWSDVGRCKRLLKLSTRDKLRDPDTLLTLKSYAMRLVDDPPQDDDDGEIFRRALTRVQKLRRAFPQCGEFRLAERSLKDRLGVRSS